MSLTEMVRDVAAKRSVEVTLRSIYDENYENFIREHQVQINDLETAKVERLNAEEKLRFAVLAATEEEVKATIARDLSEVLRRAEHGRE